MSTPHKIPRTSLALLAALCAVAGCGESQPAGRTVAERARTQVKSARSRKPAARTAHAPTSRLFSPLGIWNRTTAADASLAPDSAAIVAGLQREVDDEEASRRGPWINTTSYGVPILTVPSQQPTVAVSLDHAPDEALSAAWSAVPLPSDAQPAQGSDGYMVVWQPSTDRMWEFWRLHREQDAWHASWGGAMGDVSRNPGVFGPDAWPGAKPWWGASASSLPLAGGAMRIEELQRGQIDHALAVALPDVRAGVIASPAQRTDGSSQDPLALPEGARLRLDPALDLTSLQMPPLTRAMAVAAQRYGIVVRDFAANIAFFGEDPASTGSDPYHGAAGLFGGEYPAQLLASFPWSHLQVLRMKLRANP